MRVEFPQGVPDECVEWLWNNVGPGNLVPPAHKDTSFNEYSWFYKRERVYPQPHEAFDPRDWRSTYVPTITVNDPKLATWFALKWG